uniref:Reverse transcriptase/retrotransposon-derived protein RNase H-like domain-containing protein n=1 Tax=Fagus sylvatica TaxID=28930 RepID=A0A2N9FMY2_FAGSY
MPEERVVQPEAPRMTMYQLLHPTQSSIPSCIMFPPNAPHNVIETAKLRFFPFSLKDKTKGWLYTVKPRSIGNWGEMTQEFYKKFFPPRKVQQVKRKISSFVQGNDETFMAWERFKDTYNFCPTHGYDTWRLKEPEDAMDYLDEITENSNTWNGPSPLDSTNRNRSSATTSGGSIFKLREEDNLSAKISLLTKEIEALKLKGSRGVNAKRGTYEGMPDLPKDRPYHKETPFPNSTQSEQQSLKIVSKDNHEECKAVTILKSGKVIGEEIEKGIPRAKEKSKETQAEKDESGTPKVKEVEKCSIPTPFPQALRLPKNLDMSAYAKVIKNLCTVKKKHHLKKTAFFTKQVSVIIQHKVPPKYKDPGSPTISCTIGEYLVELALLDLGASINLLSFTIYQQMGLGDLKPTSITLQLADRSVRTPRGIVEDVLIKIENFYYPVDFIILEPTLHPDNGIPIILGRPFLATANALINCRNGRMKITFGSMTAELNIFNVMQQQLEDDECHYVNLIDTVVQEEFNRNCFSDPLETLLTNSVDSYDIADDAHLTEICSLLDSSQVLEEEQMMVINEPWRPHFEELPKTERKPMPSSEDIPQLELKPLPNGFKYTYLSRIYLEDDCKTSREPQRRLNPTMKDVVKNEVIKLLDAGIIYPISDSWRMCIDYRKLNSATRKDHFPLPFIDQILERVAGHKYYCFLDGYSSYYQIEIALEDQGKTTFTCPFGTFAFHDLSVFGDSFDDCLNHLKLVLAMCVEKGLVLNWEKCHFMVTSGIVLGHVVSSKGIEVDKAKVDLILNLPTPKTVRDVRSFLGHAGFHRRFIKDFSSISRPLCNLLLKESTFEWTKSCEVAFKKLVQLLTSAPIMQAPDWSLPFKIMCDASDYAMGAVLGQRKDKKPHVIYYASGTQNSAQMNYTTTEKELLAVEFNIEIKDKKGVENVVADHLSRFTFEEVPFLRLGQRRIGANSLLRPLILTSKEAGELRSSKMSELEELRNEAYISTRHYKERMKLFHDKKIVRKTFEPNQTVLLYDSKLHTFSGKLRTRWDGPYIVKEVFDYGAVVIEDPRDG